MGSKGRDLPPDDAGPMSETLRMDGSATQEAAKAWLLRLHAPDAGAQDWLAFDAWLQVGPERRVAYDQAAARWEEENAALDEAAEWVVRLRSSEAGTDEWLAFETWLNAGADRRGFYDRALVLWEELNTAAPELKRHLGLQARVVRIADRFATRRVVPFMAAGSALAAAAAAAVFLVLPATQTPAPTPTTYVTAKGERRTVVLPDGSRIDLNGGSRIQVTYGPHTRAVTLDDAEAAFDVAHDVQRPFLISAGDHTVRVVGTQFDAERHNGRISVVVRRGVVEVSSAGDSTQRLTVGRRFRGREGVPGGMIDAVGAEEAAGWRSGRLIYRDQPLSEVVDDLNRYFPEPINVAGAAVANLKFSGVLVMDKEDAVVRRIEALLPVSAERSEGAIVFKAGRESR